MRKNAILLQLQETIKLKNNDTESFFDAEYKNVIKNQF